MRPTRRPVLAATVAVLLVGCAPAPHDRPDAAASLRETADARWPVLPPTVGPPDDAPEVVSTRPTKRSAGGETVGIEQAAGDAVIALLDDEQLTVFDLTVHQLDNNTVKVEVLHGTGRGYPHASHYRLTLTATDDGGWRPDHIVVAP